MLLWSLKGLSSETWLLRLFFPVCYFSSLFWAFRRHVEGFSNVLRACFIMYSVFSSVNIVLHVSRFGITVLFPWNLTAWRDSDNSDVNRMSVNEWRHTWAACVIYAWTNRCRIKSALLRAPKPQGWRGNAEEQYESATDNVDIYRFERMMSVLLRVSFC